MALSTSTLAELVQRRHDCLRELLILVRQQQELAASGDLDRLLAVLSQKQPCLAALESLSRALAPFRDEDAERRVWADPSQRAHCQTLWNECATIYDEIVEGERGSEAVLREQRDQIGQRLETAHSTHQIHTAYLQGTRPLAPHAGGQLDLTEA